MSTRDNRATRILVGSARLKPKLWIGAGFVLVVGIAFVVSRVVGTGSRPATTIPMPRADEATLDPQVPVTELANLPLDAPDRGHDVAGRLEVASPASAPSLEIPPDAAHVRVTVRARSDATALSWITVLARPASFDPAMSTVESTRSHGVAYERLRSASDGTVEIAVTPDVPFVVHAFGRDRGYDMQEAKVPALAPNQSVDVVLELGTTDASSYWLRLLDEETDRPIAACEVVTGSEEQRRITDDAGLFALPPEADDGASLMFDVTGYGRRVVAIVPGHDRPMNALVLKLARAATLHVRAIDPNGRPRSGVALELFVDRRDLLPVADAQRSPKVRHASEGWYTRTDAEGRGTFENLTARASYLGSSSGYPEFRSEGSMTFSPGETREVDWVLGGTCTLRGRLVDQHGGPVAGCGLWLTRRPRPDPFRSSFLVRDGRGGHTDERGEFTFESLAPGPWSLASTERITQDDNDDDNDEIYVTDVAPWEEQVTIPNGATTVDVLVRSERGLALEGTVYDARGNPVAGARVTAVPTRHGHSVTTKTLEDGTFRLNSVTSAEYSVAALGTNDDASSTEVRVRGPARGIEIRMRPGTRLEARLVGDLGERADLEVRLFRRVGPWTEVSTLRGPLGDVIAFAPQPEGEYFVTAATADGYVGATSAITLHADGPPRRVDLVMARGGHVNVLLEAKDEYGWVEVIRDGVTYDRVHLFDPQLLRAQAPAGVVTLRATIAGPSHRKIERTVVVREGETTDFVIPADAR